MNTASAGAQRVPGRLVERLLELPADCDVGSALTRISLQAGIAMREVPPESREGRRWRLIRNEGEAQAAESEWIRQHLDDGRTAAPGNLLARVGMLSFGPSLLHGGQGSNFAALAAGITLLLALAAGWLGFAIAGLLCCAGAAFLLNLTALLGKVEYASLSRAAPSRHDLLGWLLDVVLTAVVIWSAPLLPWESLIDRGFPPAMLLLSLRLAPRVMERSWAPWVEDRMLLALILAAAAATGLLIGAVQVLAIVLVLAALLLPAANRG